MVDKDLLPNACTDEMPIELVRPYVGDADDVVELPSKVDLDVTPIFDQHDQYETRNGCTIYGETHVKHDQEGRVTLDPVSEVLGAEIHGFKPSFGRSLRGALNYYLGKWYIRGYASVYGVYQMKLSLFEKNPIYNWTNKASRTKTRNHPKKVFQYTENGNGHAYAISGYDDNYEDGEGNKGAFRCKNSSKNFPTFRVMYYQVELGYLYSTISIILDPDRVVRKKEEENNKQIELAIEKGITNGENLDENITRGQLAVMLGRDMYGTELTYQEYIEKTEIDGIRNGKRENDNVVRYEAMIMLARYIVPLATRTFARDHQLIEALIKVGVTNGDNQDELATRKEGILLVIRSIIVKDQRK